MENFELNHSMGYLNKEISNYSHSEFSFFFSSVDDFQFHF